MVYFGVSYPQRSEYHLPLRSMKSVSYYEALSSLLCERYDGALLQARTTEKASVFWMAPNGHPVFVVTGTRDIADQVYTSMVKLYNHALR